MASYKPGTRSMNTKARRKSCHGISMNKYIQSKAEATPFRVPKDHSGLAVSGNAGKRRGKRPRGMPRTKWEQIQELQNKHMDTTPATGNPFADILSLEKQDGMD